MQIEKNKVCIHSFLPKILGRQDVSRGHRQADDDGSSGGEERAVRGQGQDRGRRVRRRARQEDALHVQGRRGRQRGVGRGGVGHREGSNEVRRNVRQDVAHRRQDLGSRCALQFYLDSIRSQFRA